MCAKMKSPDEFNNLVEFMDFLKDEATCLKYLEDWMWGGKMRCPYCGYEDPYRFKDGKRFKCRNCREAFTAKIGTIFQSSQLPLKKWFIAIYLIASNKKGISSCQLARQIGVTQKTAWHMAHKIRTCLKLIPDEKLEGIIEIDETFVGGRNKNRHKAKRIKYAKLKDREYPDKMPVFGMLNRDGEVRAIVIPDPRKETLLPLIETHIKRGSTIFSDDWAAYDSLHERYNHSTVCHSKGRYREGDTYTNGIESFWSQLKRMIIGIYYRVTPKHLQKYVDELAFRFNNRKMTEGERVRHMFAHVNCRVSHKQLTLKYG